MMKTRICGFTVEFGRSQFDPEVLKACGDRIVMVGCIDPGSSPAPSVDSVKRRVAGVLEYLSPGQVWLAPDCCPPDCGVPDCMPDCWEPDMVWPPLELPELVAPAPEPP